VSRPRARVVQAPMAVASDGGFMVNAVQLTIGNDLDAVVRVARETGLPVFVGLIVPARLRRRILRDIDDAAADVVGRVGSRLQEQGKR
jgi:hypothetical protein